MTLEKASKEEMKQEALERMKILKLYKNVIDEFKNENLLNCSEGLQGILFWLDEKEEQIVREYENNWNVIVYHVIKTYTVDMGCIYDLLYIANEKECWEEQREFLKQGYVASHTISQFNESGDIMITNRNGGLVRVY